MSLLSWFQRRQKASSAQDAPVRIVEREDTPALAYAIGDIHGCYDKFSRLEDRILDDAEKRSRNAVIVALGDVIDRGPESSRVIDRLLTKPPEGVTRLCLSGNHEASMAEFLDRPRFDAAWLGFGGIETLSSYGIDANRWRLDRLRPKMISYQLDAFVPPEHMQFVAGLPYLVRFGSLVFVHAGIDPKKPLARQTERDLLWMRPGVDTQKDEGEGTGGEEKTKAKGLLVVHGHTPVADAYVSPLRINIDTGAYAGGALSAARFVDGKFDGLLNSEDPHA